MRSWSKERFIPAPAGNGFKLSGLRTPDAVHPRACGERFTRALNISISAGSSPRLRGTDPQGSIQRHAGRFIPAPAGNGNANPPDYNIFTVHPRACGERLRNDYWCKGLSGSSPRLRGTVPAKDDHSCVPRFIPAPAGNGYVAGREGVCPAVHPRACGERVLAAIACDVARGSSPRLRGTDRAPSGAAVP